MAIQSNFPAIRPSLLLDFANSKRLDPRVTFARASTATYYDGVTTAKAEENLFSRSQEFDQSPWTVTNAVATADTTAAPDGTTTADTLTANAGTGLLPVFSNLSQTTISGASYVVSVHALAGTYSFVQIYLNNQGAEWANFDLSTGIAQANGSCVATATALGGGWYRLSMAYTAGGTDRRPFFMLAASASATRAQSWSPVGTETVVFWGAQFEQRNAVTAYTPTTTQPITNYIPRLMTAPANVARFDHNPVTDESLGLLVEESRQNVWLRSDDFANAAWTKTASSITANTIVAPDGTLTGDKLVEDTANSAHYVLQAITSVISTTYTASVYLKAAERSAVRLSRNGGVVGSAFDLSAGTVTNAAGSTGTITAVGNGWYRCSISFAGASVTDSVYIELQTSASTSSQTYTGDGYSGVYVWGAQWETGAFATSYIPTVASAVTRSADGPSMTGDNFSSWFNNAEGTMYVDAQSNGATANAHAAFAVSDDTTNNTMICGQLLPTAVRGFVRANAADQGTLSVAATVTVGYSYRFALAYATNNVAISLNGDAPLADTSAIIPVVDRAAIGRLFPTQTGQILNGTIRKIAYYPLRLTDAQLQAITE
jgi:hypothetical protein